MVDNGQVPKIRKAPPDRLTVVERISHTRSGHGTKPYGKPYEIALESNEQPYERELVADKEPSKLVVGCWVELPGLILVRNDDADKPLLVGYLGCAVCHDFVVPPGTSGPFMPRDPAALQITSPDGPAHYTLTVFPR